MVNRRVLDYSRASDDQLLANQANNSVADNESTIKLTKVQPASSLFLAPMFKRVLDSNFVTVFMTILTVYALFADDLRVLAFSLKEDDYFFGLASCCFGFFGIEIILSFYAKPQYRFSFYFYLDSLATLSMIPDIGWIWSKMIGTTSGSGSQASQIQNAGKASRAGARTTRIIRIVRLIRLIRLVKLYKSAKRAMEAAAEADENSGQPQAFSIPKESKIGQKLSDLTTRRVIILVLLLLTLLPLFDLSFFLEPPRSWTYGINMIEVSFGTLGFDTVLQKYLQYHGGGFRPIIFLSYEGMDFTVVWSSNTDPNDLRFAEKQFYTGDRVVTIVDMRNDTRLEAGLNMTQTLFVCFTLTLGAVYLTKDANNLVIIPIEKMMDKVQRLTQNPAALSDEKIKDVYDLENEKKSLNCCKKKRENKENMETFVLESTILKIGALLALCFGEAGSGIITVNLEEGQAMESLTRGKKTMAIFGFCQIRNFADITEILLEGVMLFVNEIAKIVHHTVNHYLGFPNSNFGDSFLVVWKIDPKFIVEENSELKLQESTYLSSLADGAIIALLKIVSVINRDPALLKYRDNQGLLLRLPNYAVRLGFGLHVGWAIEGPIGSIHKIDTSYVSPHVNLASNLQQTTKLYGVSLIMSGMVQNLMSAYMKSQCRHIDTVQLKNTGIPVRLFTYDLEGNFIRKQKPTNFVKNTTKLKRKRLEKAIEKEPLDTEQIFTYSQKLKRLRRKVDPEFLRRFQKAMHAYESGLWKDCKKALQEALRINPYDSPSLSLMKFLQSYNFQAPGTWQGYRELTDI